jgi:plasmid replication initiation protein
MEHPFFALGKRKDTTARHYVSPDGKTKVTVTPGMLGMPTIWDKDILIYSTTLAREAMNRGDLGPENSPIQIDIYNFLRATYRGDGSQQYIEVAKALRRLYGCVVETDIETNDKRYQEGFHLLNHYRIVTKTRRGLISCLEVTLSDWLYGAVWNGKREMLSINRDYFRLQGGVERRLYEIARKHCGQQAWWKVSIPVLWEKSGSQSELKKFRHVILKGQANLGTLPDYRVELRRDKDQLIFYSRHYKRPVMAMLDVHNLMD